MGGRLVLEDEMIDTGGINGTGSAEQVSYLHERVSELNHKLEGLMSRIAGLEQELEALRSQQAAQPAPAAVKAAPDKPAAARSEAPAPNTSSTIQDVLRKVYSGDAEGAQKLLLALSKDEMQRNTSVVALVAATLCIRRGDMNGGLTALQRARQFTDDPRLLKVIDMVEQQISENA